MSTLIALGVIALVIYGAYAKHKEEQERQYREAVRAAAILIKARIEEFIADYNRTLRQAVIEEVGGRARFNELKSGRNPKYDPELKQNAHVLMSYFVFGVTYFFLEPLLDGRLGYGLSDDSSSSVMLVHRIYQQSFRHRRNDFFTDVDPSVIYQLRNSDGLIDMAKSHTHILHGVYGISKYDLVALCCLFTGEICERLRYDNPFQEAEINTHAALALTNLSEAFELNKEEVQLVCRQVRDKSMGAPQNEYNAVNILEDDIAGVLVKHKANLFNDQAVHLIAQLAHLNDVSESLARRMEKIKQEAEKH